MLCGSRSLRCKVHGGWEDAVSTKRKPRSAVRDYCVASAQKMLRSVASSIEIERTESEVQITGTSKESETGSSDEMTSHRGRN